MDSDEILLVYDRECPACNAYCQMADVSESAGKLRIVDARENSEVMDEITSRGLDIDQGMVLKLDGNLYYGADAINALARISSRSGIFNRFNYWAFKSKRVSSFVYPVLRFFRNLLLRILGKTRINNLKIPGNDKF